MTESHCRSAAGPACRTAGVPRWPAPRSAVAAGLPANVVADVLFGYGGTLKWVAVAAAKWSSVGPLRGYLGEHANGYVTLLIAFAAVFLVAIAADGAIIAGFLVIFIVSTTISATGASAQENPSDMEPPLTAIALGLFVSNPFRPPAWFAPALRVGFYIKAGIVLLGATLPLTLIVWAGPLAIGQATIVSLLTFFVIHGVARLPSTS